MSPKPPVFAREAFLRHGFDAPRGKRNRAVGECCTSKKEKGLARQKPSQALDFHGAGNRNRTYDLRITNAPLYQLSYSGEAA